MPDLKDLFTKWKDARLRYPSQRREAEDAFFGGLVEAIDAIEAENIRRRGGRPAKAIEEAA